MRKIVEQDLPQPGRLVQDMALRRCSAGQTYKEELIGDLEDGHAISTRKGSSRIFAEALIWHQQGVSKLLLLSVAVPTGEGTSATRCFSIYGTAFGRSDPRHLSRLRRPRSATTEAGQGFGFVQPS